MNPNLFLLVILILFFSSCSSSKKTITKSDAVPVPKTESYLGKVYLEYGEIKGFDHIGGRTLSGKDDTYKGKEYAISFYENKENVIIVFFEEIRRDNSNGVSYKILDQLAFYKPSEDAHLILDCLSERYPRTELICLCKIQDKEWYEAEYFEYLVKAWRLNRDKNKIEEIETSTIRGLNSSYGL